MNQGQKLIQAYKNTPWRRQLQVIGLYTAVVIFLAIVAGVYLNVTALAAIYGRDIQEYRRQTLKIEQDIQDIQSELALHAAVLGMAQKAEDMNFVSVNPNNATYLKVPGYKEDQPIELAPEIHPLEDILQNQLPLEYTESLFDWISSQIYKIGLKTGAAESP